MVVERAASPTDHSVWFVTAARWQVRLPLFDNISRIKIWFIFFVRCQYRAEILLTRCCPLIYYVIWIVSFYCKQQRVLVAVVAENAGTHHSVRGDVRYSKFCEDYWVLRGVAEIRKIDRILSLEKYAATAANRKPKYFTKFLIKLSFPIHV